MEFFPALLVILGMFAFELASVFILNSRTLDYSSRIVLGLVSFVGSLCLFVVLFQGLGWWAVAWLVGSWILAKALWYNYDGTRPLAEKE